MTSGAGIGRSAFGTQPIKQSRTTKAIINAAHLNRVANEPDDKFADQPFNLQSDLSTLFDDHFSQMRKNVDTMLEVHREKLVRSIAGDLKQVIKNRLIARNILDKFRAGKDHINAPKKAFRDTKSIANALRRASLDPNHPSHPSRLPSAAGIGDEHEGGPSVARGGAEAVAPQTPIPADEVVSAGGGGSSATPQQSTSQT